MELTERVPGLEAAVNSTPLATGRIAYTVIGLLCLILISSLLGLKIAQVFSFSSSPTARKLTPLNLVIFALYIDAILLLFVELLFSSGITFANAATCRATGVLDTLFFFASKVLLQLFLLERLRIARRALHDRWRDPLYVVPLAVLGAGFVILAIVGFRWLLHVHEADMSTASGTCAIGFPNGVAAALRSFDIFVSIGVTALFLWVLRDAMRASKEGSVSRVLGRVASRSEAAQNRRSWKKLTKTDVTRVQSIEMVDAGNEFVSLGSEESLTQQQARSYGDERVIRLIRKSLIGAMITYVPFSINLAMLVSLKGTEQGWFCFIICTLDSKSRP
jgi:hypothetical protein